MSINVYCIHPNPADGHVLRVLHQLHNGQSIATKSASVVGSQRPIKLPLIDRQLWKSKRYTFSPSSRGDNAWIMSYQCLGKGFVGVYGMQHSIYPCPIKLYWSSVILIDNQNMWFTFDTAFHVLLTSIYILYITTHAQMSKCFHNVSWEIHF